MKYLTFASILSLLSSTTLAAIKDIQLIAESNDQEINSKGLSSIHEGAGINYFFLGENPQNLKYDDEKKQIYILLNVNNGQQQVPQSLNFNGKFLSLSVSEPLAVEIDENDILQFDGSNNLFAAKDQNDPYQYSRSSYAIVNEDGEDHKPLSIKALFVNGDDDSSSSSEAPSSSIPPISLPSPISSSSGLPQYPNGTTSTKTDIQTTTLTITSCKQDHCKTSTITTGLTTRTEWDTTYVTYCPLPSETETHTEPETTHLLTESTTSPIETGTETLTTKQSTTVDSQSSSVGESESPSSSSTPGVTSYEGSAVKSSGSILAVVIAAFGFLV
ncbi:uncharacterized protein KGF55_000270 [Candida pseudojiufengensis]|uniref:uncharacterized protein n=1 Tax=Candida pseudojiufengensis TaxID=497109 RepID=UPI0022250B2A|nr:uncharacterized protein KGF55_000270 [Candida pseudojiufengensis]KAI5966861.1 hypothetical protein KGF55_000270 [Candida pseudojiufengensis]